LRKAATESDVLSNATGSDAHLTDAHAWLGLNAQLEGSSSKADEHFSWVKEHGTPDSYSFILSTNKIKL
jgi:hypothetical protein